jgi:histidine ammonia-lyase
VDSIVSSNGQEDHVSMGANAATKAYKIVENIKTILAIELLSGAQALEFHQKKTSTFLASIVSILRSTVPRYEDDRVMYTDINKAKEVIENMMLDEDVLDF